MPRKLEAPDYVANRPSLSESAIWDDLELDFSDGSDMIRNLRFETKEDAAKFRWKRNGGLTAAHNSTLDTDDLKRLQTELSETTSFVRQALANRTLSLELLARWGHFQWAAGRLATALYAEGSGERRRQPNQSKERQDRWIGIQLRSLVEEDGRSRQQAEDIVFNRVKKILLDRQFTRDFDEKWFKGLLSWDQHGKAKNLAERFLGENGKLPNSKLRRYLGAPTGDIPPIPSDGPSGLA